MKFPGSIKTKFPKVSESIFSYMSSLANQNQAINLAQGFPDFMPDKGLIDRVSNAMIKGFNQYAPMAGIINLREKLCEKMEDLYSASYNPDTEITIVPGATIGIYTAITSMLKPNEEVIIFEPAYDSYLPAIEAAGAVPIFAELKFPLYKPDWEEVKKLVNSKTKMIIINTPHNPSGSIFSAEDMIKLEKLVKGTDIIILSDEVYEHILFDDYEHQSVARFPDLAKRSFIVFSFGKTYHNTGWKMGYVFAPQELMSEFRKIYQYIAFSANTPMQYAFMEMLENKEYYLQIGKMYQQKRNLFNDGLKASQFKILPSSGTYFQLLNFSKISDQNDFDFAVQLTTKNKIAAIPISKFYRKNTDHKMLRFCFAKGNETLLKSIDILCKI